MAESKILKSKKTQPPESSWTFLRSFYTGGHSGNPSHNKFTKFEELFCEILDFLHMKFDVRYRLCHWDKLQPLTAKGELGGSRELRFR